MQEQIEFILEEANAYGLRWEVDESAQKIIMEEFKKHPDKPQINIVKAYEMAFREWIK
jgi:hypothetical protein